MSEVMEEAYAILYPKSKPLTEETVSAEGTIFAVNTLPEYSRQAVMAVPTAQHKGLKSVSAQVSKDGKTGYVLVDASDAAECAVGRTKGMFADVQRASGKRPHRNYLDGTDIPSYPDGRGRLHAGERLAQR